MERATDIVIDISVQQEIERLKADIDAKCKQIADLYGYGLKKEVTWTKPAFYKKDGNKKSKI